jgi:hypothetical protein
MWVGTISILTITNELSPSLYCDKNQGELCPPNSCFLYYMHSFFIVDDIMFYGRSDPAPMTAPIPFGMNSSSSQLLDLLHALRFDQFFFFFSLTYFKATH